MTRQRAYAGLAGLVLLAGVALVGSGEVGPVGTAQHGKTVEVTCD